MNIAWIVWDPPRIAFNLPFINHPVAWYGVCFAFGFVIGFLLIIPLLRRALSSKPLSLRDVANWPLLIKQLKLGRGNEENSYTLFFRKLPKKTREAVISFSDNRGLETEAKDDILRLLTDNGNRSEIESLFPKGLYTLKELSLFLADRITWFVVIGTLIGARLGHVFFYNWPYYQDHPGEIIKIWEGGLASHGGTLGVILALFLFHRSIKERFPEFTFLSLLDILCVPTAMAAVWIRIGNFFNQEIVGPVSLVPWAIIFAHPMEGEGGVPRHPAQLYEAICYLATFCLLYFLWYTRSEKLKPGFLFGLFMILTFGSRFLIEFVKIPQSLMIDETFLLTGQYLSLPFILVGCAALFISNKSAERT